MSCADELAALEAAEAEQDDAEIDLETARRKAKNRLKGAGAACAIGAFGAIGGLPGLLAGGSACIGGLLVADDAAADFEAAQKRADRAADRASEARIKWVICMQRHQMGASRGDPSVS